MNELARRLCTLARDRSSGLLEWNDGARRRLFYFQNGDLVRLQSNLKSESMERVTNQHPNLDPAGAKKQLMRMRVDMAFAERGGEMSFGPTILPDPDEGFDVLAFALDQSGKTLSPDCFPKATASCAAWVNGLPIDSAFQAWLRDLDGTRPIEDVLAFGPAEPARIERAIKLLIELGGVVDVGGEAQGYVVRMVGPRTTTSTTDDLASMIESAHGPTTPVPLAKSDPVEAFFGPALRRIRSATDHFAVLGVSWKDAPETIRRSYFTLARELHPDRFTTENPQIQETASELFDKVRSAWEMLGDDTKREAYIARVIRGEKTEEELAMEKVKSILEGESIFKRGISAYYAGRMTDAHELFRQARERVPDEGEFNAYYGYTTYRLNTGKDDRAAEEGVQLIQEALRNNEKLDAVHVLLGMVQRQQGDDAAAKRSFTQALRIKPSNPDAVRELKRLESKPPPAPEKPTNMFSRFFGKKA